MKVDGGIDADPANAKTTAELAEAASYNVARLGNHFRGLIDTQVLVPRDR